MQENKDKRYEKICTKNSFHPINKPEGVRLAVADERIIPASCKESKSSTQCVNEKLKQQQVDANVNDRLIELKQFREQAKRKFDEWSQAKHNSVHNVMSTINSVAEAKIFNDLISLLRELKQYQYKIQLAQDVGNCAEESYAKAIDLINAMIQQNEYSKLQIVKLYTTTSIENKITDHQFVLLDSNFDDVKIFNDVRKVKAFLKNPNKKSRICDGWNNYYAPLRNDLNGLYNNDVSWESLEITSLPVAGLKQLSDLDASARQFFCQEFAEIGLEVAGLACPRNNNVADSSSQRKQDEGLSQQRQNIF